MIGKQKVAIFTGSAGFIGYHISLRLLEKGWRIIGIDCIGNKGWVFNNNLIRIYLY